LANLTGSFIGLDLSASEVKAMMPDWPDAMVNDYTSVINSLRQLASAIQVMDVGIVDPNGVVTSNNSRQYFNSVTNKLWVNPVVGVTAGWVSIN
jgi:hypothetical protein